MAVYHASGAANLAGAKLNGVDLRGSNLDGAILPYAPAAAAVAHAVGTPVIVEERDDYESDSTSEYESDDESGRTSGYQSDDESDSTSGYQSDSAGEYESGDESAVRRTTERAARQTPATSGLSALKRYKR